MYCSLKFRITGIAVKDNFCRYPRKPSQKAAVAGVYLERIKFGICTEGHSWLGNIEYPVDQTCIFKPGQSILVVLGSYTIKYGKM